MVAHRMKRKSLFQTPSNDLHLMQLATVSWLLRVQVV
jgi:hypothetical protein